MKKTLLLLLSISILAILAVLPVAAQDTRYRVAVLPFDDGAIQHRWWGNNWDVGAGVSDELITELLNTGKFRLIDREQIDRIMREQDYGVEGRVDPRSAAKIGKILGVHYLIMGKVTEFSTDSQGGGVALKNFGLAIKTNTARVSIDARLVDATTAEIKAAVTGKGEKKQTSVGIASRWNAMAIGSNEFKQTNLGQALRDAVVSVSQQLTEQTYADDGGNLPAPPIIEGNVADIYGNKVYLTLGSSDGVQPGMNFDVLHVIRAIKNPDTGEIIDYVTEPVAVISVVEVKDKSAICVVVTKLNNKFNITPKDLVKLSPKR